MSMGSVMLLYTELVLIGPDVSHLFTETADGFVLLTHCNGRRGSMRDKAIASYQEVVGELISLKSRVSR